MSDENNVRYEGTTDITYTPWHEHIVKGIKRTWITFFKYSLAGLSLCGTFIGLGYFFFPNIGFNKVEVLLFILISSILTATFRCIYLYRNLIPEGLENESLRAQKIARYQKPFWEYALSRELIKIRIEKIDQDIDDLVNNRVHVKLRRSLDISEYFKWIENRPENLLRMVDTTNQLLITDLSHAIQVKDNSEIDLFKLVRIANLIKNLCIDAYKFEVEGREIKPPEGFEKLHEIQIGWVSVVRDGFHQFQNILKEIENRDKNDLSPVQGGITFGTPPRIDEYNDELERIGNHIEQILQENEEEYLE